MYRRGGRMGRMASAGGEQVSAEVRGGRLGDSGK